MVNQRVQDLVKSYFSLAMNHTEILQSLVHLNNVIVLSMRTLRRLLKSAALYRRKEYSDILDVSIYLMELLRNSNKSHGYKFVHLNFIQKGFVIRQETVRLYPRHTGGAVALWFLVKSAITVVTLPVVFHSFPLPVTRVFLFAVRRNHSDVTADMAIPLSYNCGLMAVPRRSLAA